MMIMVGMMMMMIMVGMMMMMIMARMDVAATTAPGAGCGTGRQGGATR